MVTRFTSLVAVVASAGAVALAVLAGPGCSIDTRSDAYACDPGCPSDRTCVDGWCVSRDGGGGTDDARVVDARPIDGPACPAQCTSCAAGVCTITCGADGSCAAPVACPPGMPCVVECNGDGSCAAGVQCAPGQACTVTCDGTSSCGGEVRCGTGRCEVQCGGVNSCAAGVECSTSCRCDTQCAPTACQGGNNCPGPAQCEPSGDCTSQSGVCRSC